jgi:hypothetical protein
VRQADLTRSNMFDEATTFWNVKSFDLRKKMWRQFFFDGLSDFSCRN